MSKPENDADQPIPLPAEATRDLQRLNRIAGQVEGVKKMVVERRYCPDIITQLRAVRAAIRSLEASMLEVHLHACVTAAFQSKDREEKVENISELKELYTRFDE